MLHTNFHAPGVYLSLRMPPVQLTNPWGASPPLLWKLPFDASPNKTFQPRCPIAEHRAEGAHQATVQGGKALHVLLPFGDTNDGGAAEQSGVGARVGGVSALK